MRSFGDAAELVFDSHLVDNGSPGLGLAGSGSGRIRRRTAVNGAAPGDRMTWLLPRQRTSSAGDFVELLRLRRVTS
ncbi:hypothetical protein Drorol1_Dr00021907 [Drosera rotundifolia]